MRNVQEIPFSMTLGDGWNYNKVQDSTEQSITKQGHVLDLGNGVPGLLAPEVVQSQNLARRVVQAMAAAP